MKRKKGHCFESAGRAVLIEEIPGLVLCHGKVMGRGRIQGQEFDHAWCEIGDMAYDPEVEIFCRIEEYYKIGQVHEVRRFTRDELASIVMKHRHWGPWPEDQKGGSSEG